jgi:MerR family transcriptional regulator, copper efflux regulator
MSAITIGQLAELSDVTTDTIRFYEKLKLLRPWQRTRSGYRLYDDSAVLRLTFIRRAKFLGFSLEEIKKLLALNATNTASCDAMLKITNAKILETRTKLQDLSRIRSILSRLAKDCPGGSKPISECPILEFLRSPKHRKPISLKPRRH